MFSHRTKMLDIRAILDWDTEHKARIICVVCAVTGLWVLICIALNVLFCVMAGQPVDRYFNIDQLMLSIILVGAYTLLTSVTSYLSDNLSKWISPEFMVHVCVFYYCLGNFLATYFFGLLSLILGVFLIGSPIVALILLDKEVLLKYLYFAVTICLLLFAATLLGHLSYAALFVNALPLQDNPYYFGIVTPISITHSVALLTFAYFAINYWREREQQVEYLSKFDSLTGVPNRRWWDLLLVQIVNDSLHATQPFAIAIFDIDHFKRINDSFGHLSGDMVISEVVRRVQDRLRTQDVIGRYGGDEFTIILPTINAATADAICEQCRKAVSDTPLVIGGKEVAITISIGLLTIDSVDASAVEKLGVVNAKQSDAVNRSEILLSRADNALYEAKKQGRNRVVSVAYANS